MASPLRTARSLPFPMDQEDVPTRSTCLSVAHVCPSELSLQILEFPAQMVPSPHVRLAHVSFWDPASEDEQHYKCA